MTVIDGGQRCRQLFGGRGATCMHHDGRMRFSCGALSLSSYELPQGWLPPQGARSYAIRAP